MQLNKMRKMSLLFSTMFAMLGCVVTDLSDLDSLNINTKDGLTVTPLSQAESETQSQIIENTTSETQQQQNNDSGVEQTETCELVFCDDLMRFESVYEVGDKISFGYENGTVEGFYELSDDMWLDWYNEQYGIQQYVKMIRYTYDMPVNDKTVVIETFYNRDYGEFLFSRVLYQGDYDNMKNFIVVIDYENRRPDFDPDFHFKDNSFSNYFNNGDEVYYAVVNYIQNL